jgi:TPR repeat protein
MVGFDLERGWGADKDPVGAKAYYQKACSMGRKNDCGR